MIQPKLTGIILICIALCFALPAQEKTPPPAPGAPTPASPSAPAAPPAESDLVVFKVQGEPISEKSVLAAIRQIAGQKMAPPSPEQSRSVMLFQGAVDNLIISAVLKNEAKARNVIADPAKVDQQMLAFEKQFPTREDFQKALVSQKVTEEVLRKRVEENQSIQQMLDEAAKDVPAATEDEILQFYEKNTKAFARPERVHAAHVLLKTDKNATPEQKAEIRKKIETIRADIEAGKLTFEDAAAKFSEDKGNAPKGGDLGYFPRGTMVKPFEEAAFAAQPGTLSPIIETDFGYHIIKAIDRKPADTVPLEEAKSRIKQYLDEAGKRRVTQKYVDSLKSKANVETFMTAEEFLKRHPEVK